MGDSLHPEHQDLLQFLYQFPVGVIAMNEVGAISTMNPAASNLLSTEVDLVESVAEPLPILQRLVPELTDAVFSDPNRLGYVTTKSHVVDCSDGITRFSVTAHRLRQNHIIFTLTDVTEERRILNEQRSRAQRLQQALLGHVDQTSQDVSVSYVPAHREDLSGGDWYDVISLGENRIALVVGDVVGHDIEASATMGQLRAVVRAFALIDADPIRVLANTDIIARSIDGAECATIHYAVLDHSTSTVTYASAGHPPPLLVRSDGSVELLNGGRRPLLTVSGPDDQTASVHLDTGDVLIMYTDGLVERRDETLEQGFDRLKKVASTITSDQAMDEFVEHLTDEMVTESTNRDDVCVLAFRY